MAAGAQGLGVERLDLRGLGSGKQADKDAEIRLSKPTVTVTPGKSVALHTGVTVKQQVLTLDLTGGSLADLLFEDRPWPTIKVVASGKLDRETVEVRGDVGPLAAPLAGRGLRVDLAVHHSDVKASLKGTLAKFDRMSGSKLAVKASGKRLSALGPLLGIDLPEGQRFAVSARLDGGDNRLDIQDFKATSGDSDLEGKLRIHFDTKTRIVTTFASRSIDLTPYLAGKSGPQPMPPEACPIRCRWRYCMPSTGQCT